MGMILLRVLHESAGGKTTCQKKCLLSTCSSKRVYSLRTGKCVNGVRCQSLSVTNEGIDGIKRCCIESSPSFELVHALHTSCDTSIVPAK